MLNTSLNPIVYQSYRKIFLLQYISHFPPLTHSLFMLLLEALVIFFHLRNEKETNLNEKKKKMKTLYE